MKKGMLVLYRHPFFVIQPLMRTFVSHAVLNNTMNINFK